MTRIYFDNAATTAVSPTVVAAMLPFYIENIGNPSSIHADGRKARTAIEQSRKTIAQYLNASISEIFFTSGGTEANNMVIKRAAIDLGVTRLITTPIEHHCVLHAAEAMHRDMGLEILYLPVNESGSISLEALETFLKTSNTKTLVSIMHANNEIGTLQPIAQIAELCQEYAAYFHTDTVQTIGHLRYDLQKTPIHFLTGSAHKFHGPKGVGFLYMNSSAILQPFIDGGAQERNMRGGTENVAGLVGMAMALAELKDNLEARETHIAHLRAYFIQKLKLLFGNMVHINGENTVHHILSISFPPSLRAELLIFNLDIEGVSASGGSACSSGIENASHVLAAIQPDSTRRTVRFSFSYKNTVEEIDSVVAILQKIVAGG